MPGLAARRPLAWAFLAMALCPLYASAAEPASAAQRKLAAGLAVAHLRAEYRRYPQLALPHIDYNHPQLIARRASSGRRLIFVSFNSGLSTWGEYVTFEVCAHLARIVRVDAGRISDVGLYRRTVASIDVATPNKLPSGCVSEGSSAR